MSLVRLVFDLPEQLLSLHWKRWMTRHFVSRYLGNLSYYRINRDQSVDNPDERIAKDIQGFVGFPLSLYRGVTQTVSSLVVFGPILWHYSPRLVLFCAMWTAVDTVVAVVFNRPVLNLSYENRKLGGNFRFALVRLRTCAESVAFSRGEAAEEFELHRRYDHILSNEFRRFAWGNLISILNAIIFLLDTMIPTYVMAPLYFQGVVDLSGFTQVQAAWGRVAAALGFFARQGSNFAYNGAVGARLYTLHEACDCPAGAVPTLSDQLTARHLDVSSPAGNLLISDLNLSIQARERWLVVGTTGAGKTSLLRTLAGLWTPTAGEVSTLPPQYLEERSQDWGNVLSPGEQQRLAFARLLWQAPDFAVLDEATSALDPAGERLMYDLLSQSGCGFLSVAHRTGVVGYHERVLELLEEGQWRVHEDASAWLRDRPL